jgi:hypothetical protein
MPICPHQVDLEQMIEGRTVCRLCLAPANDETAGRIRGLFLAEKF